MAQSERPVLFDPLSDISNKKFTVVMRGYDRDEVDEFLSKLELSFKGALNEANQISSSDLAARLGQEVGSVLSSAEQAADKVRRAAVQDAARIRGEAEHEASAIRQAALEEVEALPRAAAEEAEEIIKQAEADATAIRDRATADAGEVIRDAKMIATRLENAAKAQCAELLEDALRRRHVLDERQREITKRIDYLDEAFADLRKVTDEFPDYTPAELPTVESARVIDVTDEATKPGATAAGASNRKRPNRDRRVATSNRRYSRPRAMRTGPSAQRNHPQLVAGKTMGRFRAAPTPRRHRVQLADHPPQSSDSATSHRLSLRARCCRRLRSNQGSRAVREANHGARHL
jgi:DivIVA domain-containing protein